MHKGVQHGTPTSRVIRFPDPVLFSASCMVYWTCANAFQKLQSSAAPLWLYEKCEELSEKFRWVFRTSPAWEVRHHIGILVCLQTVASVADLADAITDAAVL